MIDNTVKDKFYKDTKNKECVVYAQLLKHYTDTIYLKVVTVDLYGNVNIYDNELDGKGWKIRW